MEPETPQMKLRSNGGKGKQKRNPGSGPAKNTQKKVIAPKTLLHRGRRRRRRNTMTPAVCRTRRAATAATAATTSPSYTATTLGRHMKKKKKKKKRKIGRMDAKDRQPQ